VEPTIICSPNRPTAPKVRRGGLYPA